MRALIVEDGHSRGALAACRALAETGWSVGVACPGGNGLAARSSRCAEPLDVPAFRGDADKFAADVANVAAHGGYEVVFGTGDADILALSAARDRLPCTFPYPPHEVLLECMDKLALTRAAESHGLAVPHTTSPSSDSWEPPVVVKPRLHWTPSSAGGQTRFEATLARSRGEAEAAIEMARLSGSEPILQEVVHGHLMACGLVADPGGRILALVQQVADRTWPPATGVSCRALTVSPDDELVGGIGSLLGDLGWSGLAQMQFIVPQEGAPRLVDMNGRFYGSLSLAVAAGCNLPDLWARQSLCRPVGATPPPAIGARYQWLEGDLRRAFTERRGNLLKDLAGTLAYGRGATHSIWAIRDPRPAVHHIRSLLHRSIRMVSR